MQGKKLLIKQLGIGHLFQERAEAKVLFFLSLCGFLDLRGAH